MRSSPLAVALASLSFVVGCAVVRSDFVPAVVPAEMSVVYVFRTSGVGLEYVEVACGMYRVGLFKLQYVPLVLHPGSARCAGNGNPEDAVELMLEAGKTYYLLVETRLIGGGTVVEAVDRIDAEEWLQQGTLGGARKIVAERSVAQ